MVVLAVLLLVLVAAVVVFVVIAGAGEPVLLAWDAVNLRWEPTALLVFLAGALTVVALGAALALLRAGARRSADRRRELKRLRRAEQEGALPAQDERARAGSSGPHRGGRTDPATRPVSTATDADAPDRGTTAGGHGDERVRRDEPRSPGV